MVTFGNLIVSIMKAMEAIDHLSAEGLFYLHGIAGLVVICLLIPFSSFGQEYGLEFAANQF